METNFNFKSQICTSREQSERLLALGLKKETADIRGVEGIEHTPTYAWSLHRLIEMMPVDVSCDNVSEYFIIGKDFFVGQYVIYGQLFWKEGVSIYDNIIDCIEWLIKEGYFNKEYLV